MIRSIASFLLESDLVSQAKSNSLSFAPNPYIAAQLTICLFLNAHIDQSILSKDTLCIQVCSKEPTFTVQSRPIVNK